MAVAAAIGATASLAGSAISARAQKKAGEAQEDRQLEGIASLGQIRQDLVDESLAGTHLGRFSAEDIFGRRQQEIDLNDSIRRASIDNLANLGLNQELVQRANTATTADSIRRASQIDPNFRQNIRGLSDQARQLIQGEIPQDVVESITRARAGQAAAGGIPGAQRNATARDLGLTSLDLQQQGASLFSQVQSIREQVDPLSRQIGLNQLLVSPSQQLEIDIANNVLRNAPDPVAQGLTALNFQGAREEQLAKSNVKVPVDNVLGSSLSAAGGAITGLSESGFFSSFGNKDKKKEEE
jgi:hypothetical protein